MLRFLFRKVLPWAVLAIAAPLMQVIIRHLFRAFLRHAVIKPTAKALREADSAVKDVSQNASRNVQNASRNAGKLSPVQS